MLNINFSREVPDSTYFNRNACEPKLKDDKLIVYNGQGNRRGWGSPSVTSTIVFESTDVIAIHIGFHHKHRGSQFWRYYADGKQVEWKTLDDDTRQAILEAYEKKAPRWANPPGKLRKDYLSAKPKNNMFIGYKVCNLVDEKLTSLFDETIEYKLGKTKVQASKPDHEGGWFVHSLEGLREKYLSGNLYKKPTLGQKAIVKCECWGNIVKYEHGKIAVTYCKPIEIIEIFERS